MRPLMTEMDVRRLRSLLEIDTRRHSTRTAHALLARKLERARVVPASRIPSTVMTMNSRALCSDVVTGEDRGLMLVYPWAADPKHDRISVLSPLGVELLGASPGQTLGGGGPSSWRIVYLEYQPEAMGELHL